MRSLIAAILVSMSFSAYSQSSRFFLGAYTDGSATQGIQTANFDPESGTISKVSLAAPAKNPSYLALSPDRQFLYAACEADGGSVAAFAVGDNGALTPLNEQSSGGGGACYVSVHPSGSPVLVANYGGGSISAFPVEADGSLGERSGFVQFEGSGPNPGRQKGPHAHSIYPIGDHVVACDLGTDEVRRFRLVDGAFVATEPAAAKVPPGGGPRHLAFGPGGRQAYVANEMGLSVSIFDVDPETAEFTLRDTVPIHPDEQDGLSLAAIKTHPSGKWIAVSSRGEDRIIVFRITDDGGLEEVSRAEAGVKTPRDFSFDPSGRWLIAAGQDDDRLAVLAFDPETGALKATGETATTPKPVCVVFE
jgi:6-phosphogluconolactonase